MLKPDLMKTIPRCLECRQPISWGVHEFSLQLYGHSLCIKDQCLIGESGATAQAVDLYLALKSRNFPVVLAYFDGHKHVDIAMPGILHIEVTGPHSQENALISDLTRAIYSLEKEIPTIIISVALLDNPGTFAHVVDELSKACRVMLRPTHEFSIAFAPPITIAQLQ
jgi:hypothetical protein